MKRFIVKFNYQRAGEHNEHACRWQGEAGTIRGAIDRAITANRLTWRECGEIVRLEARELPS